MNGTVYMAFGCKIDHGPRAVLGQRTADQSGIANVALHQLVARIALQTGQCFGVAGIGQFVQVHNGFIRGGQPVEDEVGTNKTSTTSDKKCHIYTKQ